MVSDLVLPLTEEETQLIKRAGEQHNYWIGLKLDLEADQFHTTSGLLPTYEKWRAGEPNHIPIENCVLFMAKFEYSAGEWNNVRCSDWNRYICKKGAKIAWY